MISFYNLLKEYFVGWYVGDDYTDWSLAEDQSHDVQLSTSDPMLRYREQYIEKLEQDLREALLNHFTNKMCGDVNRDIEDTVSSFKWYTKDQGETRKQDTSKLPTASAGQVMVDGKWQCDGSAFANLETHSPRPGTFMLKDEQRGWDKVKEDAIDNYIQENCICNAISHPPCSACEPDINGYTNEMLGIEEETKRNDFGRRAWTEDKPVEDFDKITKRMIEGG